MTVVIKGTAYYRTAEVCRMVGISRNTLFRWLKQDSFEGLKRRDKRGWRLFTKEEIERMKVEANRIYILSDLELERTSQRESFS